MRCFTTHRSADGSRIVSAGAKGFTVWETGVRMDNGTFGSDLRGGLIARSARLDATHGHSRPIAWHPSGDRLLVGYESGGIALYDAEPDGGDPSDKSTVSLKLVGMMDPSSGAAVLDIAWHDSGTRFATASEQNMVQARAPTCVLVSHSPVVAARLRKRYSQTVPLAFAHGSSTAIPPCPPW